MRTTIGVAEIDSLIEGGVPRGASVLVCGEAGTGKSVLCLEFILAGIREGEPGVYVTADEPGRVLETAASLGWDLRGAIEDGYARVVQVLPPGSAAPAQLAPSIAAAGGAAGAPGDAPGGGMPMAGPSGQAVQTNGAAAGPLATGPASATVAAISDAVQEIQAERVAIDPPLGPGAGGEAAAAFIADLLRGVLEETHCTTIITGQRLHGANGYTRLGIEEQLVDGILDLRMVERDGRRQRTLSVRAMHGTHVDLDDRLFSIAAGRGIAVGE
jgi:KaiC/GvpD/RAD55 family RecA-like ATPase